MVEIDTTKKNHVIVATARNAATKLQQTITQKVDDFCGTRPKWLGDANEEILDYPCSSAEKINILLSSESEYTIFKMHPIEDRTKIIFNIDWSLVECVYFGRRQNLADQLISELIAAKNNQWHKFRAEDGSIRWYDYRDITGKMVNDNINPEPITVSDYQINKFKESLYLRKFIELFVLSKTNARIQYFDYDQISALPTTSVTVPNGYIYNELCVNYDAVSVTLREIAYLNQRHAHATK